jgi:DNA-binding YbaB/EbfC family protein
MKNLGNMLKQAQKVQERMAQLQDELAGLEVTGAAGGGMVQVTLNGRGEARRVRIDPSLGGDLAVVEDLVTAAINDARGKVEAAVAARMAEITGGLQLPPGMKLPF